MSRQMQTEADEGNQDSMLGMYLTFELAAEGYALEIQHIIEIIGIQPVTWVPDMPDHVIGVLNLRGKIIPIIDARRRLAIEPRDYDDRTCIIVVNVNGNSVGLVVDKVNEVANIPRENIEPPPAAGQDSQYVQGLGKLGRNVKIIINIDSLLETVEDEDLPDAEVE